MRLELREDLRPLGEQMVGVIKLHRVFQLRVDQGEWWHQWLRGVHLFQKDRQGIGRDEYSMRAHSSEEEGAEDHENVKRRKTRLLGEDVNGRCKI